MKTELLELAHQLGSHPSRLTIWSEGSVAVKLSPTRFAVSVRGANLAALTAADLVELELGPLQAISEQEKVADEAIMETLENPDGLIPDADVFLYAYLFSLEGVTYAAHTQPTDINQIISSPRARQFSDRRISPGEIIGCGASSVLVPYADPGLPLARELRRKMILWRDRFKTPPRLVLLQNHGMIVLGPTPPEVLRTTDITLKSAQIFIGASMLGGPVFLTPGNVSMIDAMKEL